MKKVLILPLIKAITNPMHNRVMIKVIQTFGSKLKKNMNSGRTPGLVTDPMFPEEKSLIYSENSMYSMDVNIEVILVGGIGATMISIRLLLSSSINCV
jgi:hypothetical protein